jgi:hypothetical protein
LKRHDDLALVERGAGRRLLSWHVSRLNGEARSGRFAAGPLAVHPDPRGVKPLAPARQGFVVRYVADTLQGDDMMKARLAVLAVMLAGFPAATAAQAPAAAAPAPAADHPDSLSSGATFTAPAAWAVAKAGKKAASRH